MCFAVKEEAAGFRRRIGKGEALRVLLTGMGPRNAAAALRAALAETQAGLVVSSGFAGGLRPGLASGTVLFSSEADAGLGPAWRAAGAEPGRFCFSERVAVRSADKGRLREATGADAVEMESEVIRGICREQEVPCAVVRVVLDAAEEDLPVDFNRLMTADQALDGRKLALVVLRSPSRIRGLLRLQKQGAAASRRLGEVLARVLMPLQVGTGRR